MVLSGSLKAWLCNITVPINGFSDTSRNAGSAVTFSIEELTFEDVFIFIFSLTL